MRTVELLVECQEVAQRLGYAIRHEWLDGEAGGACEFGGKKWIFVDLAQSPDEQLEQVIEALRIEPQLCELSVSSALKSIITERKAA